MFLGGAPGRNRTADLRFTKPLLYQLSYKGIRYRILKRRAGLRGSIYFTRVR